MKKLILMITALSLLYFAGCKKDSNNNNTASTKYKTLVLDVHNDLFNWRYYSFENGKEAIIQNFNDTLGWDLGVRYESFRTNGGTSGKGQGAILDLGAVNFDTVTIAAINNKTFTPDDSILVIVDMKPTWLKTPGCVPLDAMFQSPTGPPPNTYTPNNHVYILRTSHGRYLKMLGTSFFNDYGAEGYLNLNYQFLD